MSIKTRRFWCLWPLINLRIISYCDSWHIFCMLLKDQESFGWFLWKVCGASKNWLGSLKFGSILPKRKTFEIVLPWSDCWIWIKSLGICWQLYDTVRINLLQGLWNYSVFHIFSYWPFNLHIDFWKSRFWKIIVCFKP